MKRTDMRLKITKAAAVLLSMALMASVWGCDSDKDSNKMESGKSSFSESNDASNEWDGLDGVLSDGETSESDTKDVTVEMPELKNPVIVPDENMESGQRVTWMETAGYGCARRAVIVVMRCV